MAPLVVGLLAPLAIALGTAEPAPAGFPGTAAELFITTNVYTVHLTFAPDRWEAMEPEGGPPMFGPPGGPGFGGPRGGGDVLVPSTNGPGGGIPRLGPGGPRGPGRPPGPGNFDPTDFGPGMFMAPELLRMADVNGDRRVSAEEFEALADRWFLNWDKTKSGRLTGDQVRDGLNETFASPGAGGPPGPRPPGGGPPGMNLQGAEGRRNGLAAMMGIEFKHVHADLEFAGRTFQDVAVRYKGNGTFMESRAGLKRSLKIDLNRYVKGQKLAGLATINLHNCVTDASWMNEVLSYRLYRDAEVPAGRTAYARVYVTVPGKHDRRYFGLYSLVENVDDDFLSDRFGSKKGALFKPVTPDLFAYSGDNWSAYNQAYDPKGDVSAADKARVIDFARLVSQAPDDAFARQVGDYVDLPKFARYLAVTAWLSTMDSILLIGQNYYVYRNPATGKYEFIPWDLDHSFGQFTMAGTQAQREQLSLLKPYQGDKRFLERMLSLDAFKQLYLGQFKELSQTLLRPERFSAQVDEIASAIRPAVQEESAGKLVRFEKAVAGEVYDRPAFGGDPDAAPDASGAGPGQGRGFGPFGMMQQVTPIKKFTLARAASVREQLAGQSEGQTMQFGFGFGPPGGGPGGPGPGRGGGGPGERPGFGPGTFIGDAFKTALDSDKDNLVTREEFRAGFARWHAAWNTDGTGKLTEDQLRKGMNRDLSPRFPGFGEPPGGGGAPPGL